MCGEVQQAIAGWNTRIEVDNSIDLRIGINLGDVIVEDDDLYGDGVNIASRIEALANPGGVLVSSTVHDHVRDRLPFAFHDLGEQQVKTIARPVRVYSVSTANEAKSPPIAVTTYASGPASQPSVPRLSIVVLPFANGSNDPDQEYLVDGITDDLTTDLSRISGSFVISRNTAFTYKGKPTEAKQIGRELGVRYVLEGTIRRMGEQVRVNVQLIDADSAANVWAERFDTDRTNLSEAQSEITGRIARILNLELVRAAHHRIEQESSTDPNRDDLIMRGWAWFHQPQSRTSLKETLDAFKRALQIDPHSIDAKVGIAAVLVANLDSSWRSGIFQDNAVQQNVACAEHLLLQVLESNADLSMAYASLGHLRRLQSRLIESRAAFENAISLDPNNEAANRQLGWTLLFLGEPGAAIALGEKSLRLSPRDPHLPGVYLLLAWSQLVSNRVTEAVDLFMKGRIANPRVWMFSYGLAGALALRGDFDRAKAALAESLKLKPEVNSLAQWYAYLPWTGRSSAPLFWAMQEKTLDNGLRIIGFPKE